MRRFQATSLSVYNKPMAAKQKNTAAVVQREVKNGTSRAAREATPASPPRSAKNALHLCLDSMENAKDEIEFRRLTEELQKIVFRK